MLCVLSISGNGMDVTSFSSSYFGVGAEEVVEGRLGDEGSLLHALFDKVGYLQEGDFAIDKSLDGHFVGSVHNAGHVAPAGDGVVGKLEAAEGLCVGLLEGELGIFCPV